jgi:hypothetical protein
MPETRRWGMNADDFTNDTSVPDMALVDRHTRWQEHLHNSSEIMFDQDDTDYGVQMALEAMSHMDVVYAELGVWFDDASRNKEDPRG